MERPKVGVGVIILKENKVLLGKRRNAHGEGSWCFPGGHLEANESWEQCACRETREETGIEIKNLRFAAVTNDIFADEDKHYITIFMVADHHSGEASIMEEEKCEKWDWFDWDEFPELLFVPIRNLKLQGYHPFK